MKLFNKIYDFFVDYADILKLILFVFCLFFFNLFIYSYIDKQHTIEKNIIKSTKSYSIYENCRQIDENFYCWNEVNNE